MSGLAGRAGAIALRLALSAAPATADDAACQHRGGHPVQATASTAAKYASIGRGWSMANPCA